MGFTAIILVCALPVSPGSCDESSAFDVVSTHVASELGCTKGWQEFVARGSLSDGIGEKFYIRTRFRRNGPMRLAQPWSGREAENRR